MIVAVYVKPVEMRVEQLARWSCDCGKGSAFFSAVHVATHQALEHFQHHRDHGVPAHLRVRGWEAPLG